MKVVILYKPKSEYARQVETFVQDYHNRYGEGRLEILDVDSRDGSAMASLYDLWQFPAILVLANDGSVLKSWEGQMLPLIDEVAYYGSAFAE